MVSYILPKEGENVNSYPKSVLVTVFIVISTALTMELLHRFSPSEQAVSAHAESPVLIESSSPLLKPASDESAGFIMNVSAYDAGECCCGEFADGLTASGVPAVGRICAAPPEYPFGTVFHIEGYGEYVCEDRGGAIKGNKLDILMKSHKDALRFGRKQLRVRIAAAPKGKG